MSAITGISSNYYYNNNYGGVYKNPSDSAMAERTTSQVRGLDVGKENLESGKSALNIADGALSGVNDYLQSIREIAVKAKNTFSYNDDDRRSMQAQIDQYKQGIADLVGNTSYNEHQLINGENDNFNIAADSNGTSVNASGANATLEALGIKDFDVTKDFDLKQIDDALEKVGSQRSTIGAQSNAIDHAFAYNQLSQFNHIASFKEDDIGSTIKNVDNLKKSRLFDTLGVMMQKKQQENKAQQTNSLFT